jgi:hypothetical protein
MNNVRLGSIVVSLWVLVGVSSGQAQVLAPSKVQVRPPTITTVRTTQTLTLPPSVALEGTFRMGDPATLRTLGIGAPANGRRVKLVRSRDGRADYATVTSWSANQIVFTLPGTPFGTGATTEPMLIGVSTARGEWIGSPVQATLSRGGARVGRRAAGCANPDWDQDGENAIECGGADCDDGDGRRNPSASEICDADDLDEDCNPATYGMRDLDRDGAGDSQCCNADGGGGRICGEDCDDTRAGAHHGVPEVCDQVDNDCDGRSDEGVQLTLWSDRDGDGFGDPNATQQACGWSPGLSYLGNDCNDGAANIFKGQGCN